ncbi:hypothetical protein ABKV19_007701 [Rosa sericea]
MQHHLRGHGLLKFVDGSYPCPPQFPTGTNGSLTHDLSGAHEKWLEQDSFIISIITNTLSPEALTLIVGCQSSMDVWLTLKKRYASTSESHIMQLKSSLHNIRKGPDSIEKYLLRFKSVRDKLAAVGVHMSDQDVKVLILAGLPSEYGHTRQIIRGKPNIDMEEVRSLLLSAEVEIELEHNSSPLSSLTALLAHSGILHNGNSSFNGASQGMQWNGFVGLPVPYNVSMPTFTSGVLMMSNGSQPIFMMGNVNSVPNMTSSTGYISSPYVGRIQTPSSFVAQNGGNTNGMQQIYSGSQQLQNNSQNYYDGYSAQQFGSFSQNSNMQTQHSGGLTRLCSPNEGNFGSYSENYSQGYPQFCNNKNSNITYRNNNTSPRFTNTNQGPIICQICEKPGHCASKCYYRNRIEASTSIVECQICKRPGHSAKRCYCRQPQVNSQENGDTTMFTGCHIRTEVGNNAGTSNNFGNSAPYNHAKFGGHNAFGLSNQFNSYPKACQICCNSGHTAQICSQRSSPRIVVASGSSMHCQICFKIGHSAAECLRRHHYGIQQQTCATPKALSASISTQPMPFSDTAQPSIRLALQSDNASQSEVVKPLPITPAYPLSVTTHPHLQQALLKKIEVLLPETWLVPSTPDKNLMNCRQDYESTDLWQSHPLVHPG